jgi:hypothetical protein
VSAPLQRPALVLPRLAASGEHPGARERPGADRCDEPGAQSECAGEDQDHEGRHDDPERRAVGDDLERAQTGARAAQGLHSGGGHRREQRE